jgi:hypothetical protein
VRRAATETGADALAPKSILGLLCLPAAPVLPVYDDERKPRHVFAFEAASDKLLLACKLLRGDDDGKAQANDRDFFIIASVDSRSFRAPVH